MASTMKFFTFNPFQENTYIIYDETLECIIIDPGCSNPDEEQELLNFIAQQNLKPKLLVNTHCHIDHILGNALISSTFDLPLNAHQNEVPIISVGTRYAAAYRFTSKIKTSIDAYLHPDTVLNFGTTELKVLFTPGHSPGSVSFYNEKDEYCIVGDVLFYEGIGRTDLPLCNHQDLLHSIHNVLFNLPDTTVIYSGHGISTHIGYEKKYNPFL